MGYAIYENGKRWAGYGVPAICEHPNCDKEIDRGVSYACGGDPFSEWGCDMYFCGKHLECIAVLNGEIVKDYEEEDEDEIETYDVCERCAKNEKQFPHKPETKEWLEHLLNDESWEEWRKKNPLEVEEYQKQLTSLIED